MTDRGAPASTENDAFLRLCLRSFWQPHILTEARQLAGAGRVDWAALCETARAGGLAPLLHAVLRSSEWVPDIVDDCLRGAYQETAVYMGLMSVELNRVLGLLVDARLPAILLKGAALGDALYGNPALRPMTDLDLLLRKQDMPAAMDALKRGGYRSVGVEVRPGHTLDFENELVLRSSGAPSLAVELHWRLLDSPFYQDQLDEDWFWNTAQPARVAETQALVLGLEANILHLSAHYVLHHKAQGTRWICDIAGLVEQSAAGGAIDWQLVLSKAAEFRLVSSVQIVLQQLEADWKSSIPEEVVRAALRLPVSGEEQRVVHWMLSERRPVVQRFWADLASMPGWRQRASFLLANLFPSPAYMMERYGLPDPKLAPLAYPYRWAIGLLELATSRRAGAPDKPGAPMSQPILPDEGMPGASGWLSLLQESLEREGSFRWRLEGKSMQPTLIDGCEIEIVPVRGKVPLGSVVVFASGSALVAHRLVHRSGGWLVAQGDGRREPDRWLRPVQLVGRVNKARVGGRTTWPGRGEALLRWFWVGRAWWLAALRRARRLLSDGRRDLLP